MPFPSDAIVSAGQERRIFIFLLSECRLWPEAGGVVDVVIGKALFFDLLRGQISGELMDDGTDHLHMV